MNAYVIWSVMSAVFILFGIYAWVSKEAVGFWNFGQHIQVNDVKRYNRAVAKLWFVSAAFFEMIGFPLLAAGQNSAWVTVPMLGGMFWAIGVMAVYVKIENKYREGNDLC